MNWMEIFWTSILGIVTVYQLIVAYTNRQENETWRRKFERKCQEANMTTIRVNFANSEKKEDE